MGFPPTLAPATARIVFAWGLESRELCCRLLAFLEPLPPPDFRLSVFCAGGLLPLPLKEGGFPMWMNRTLKEEGPNSIAPRMAAKIEFVRAFSAEFIRSHLAPCERNVVELQDSAVLAVTQSLVQVAEHRRQGTWTEPHPMYISLQNFSFCKRATHMCWGRWREAGEGQHPVHDRCLEWKPSNL